MHLTILLYVVLLSDPHSSSPPPHRQTDSSFTHKNKFPSLELLCSSLTYRPVPCNIEPPVATLVSTTYLLILGNLHRGDIWVAVKLPLMARYRLDLFSLSPPRPFRFRSETLDPPGHSASILTTGDTSSTSSKLAQASSLRCTLGVLP